MTCLAGAVLRLAAGRPVVTLTLRYDRLDNDPADARCKRCDRPARILGRLPKARFRQLHRA